MPFYSGTGRQGKVSVWCFTTWPCTAPTLDLCFKTVLWLCHSFCCCLSFPRDVQITHSCRGVLSDPCLLASSRNMLNRFSWKPLKSLWITSMFAFRRKGGKADNPKGAHRIGFTCPILQKSRIARWERVKHIPDNYFLLPWNIEGNTVHCTNFSSWRKHFHRKLSLLFPLLYKFCRRAVNVSGFLTS